MNRAIIAALLVGTLSSCAEPTTQSTASSSAVADACDQIAEASRLGRRASFSYDFPVAEENFLKVARLQGQRGEAAPSCRRGLSKAAAEMNLGLALSSQSQFRLADAAFDDAAESLAAQPEEGMAALLNLFRAQHELHRQQSTVALDYANTGLRTLDEEGLIERNQVIRQTRSDPTGLTSAGLVSGAGAGEQALFELSPLGRDLLLAEADLSYVKSYAQLSGEDADNALASINDALESLEGAEGVPQSYRSKYEMQYASISMQRNDIQTAINFSGRASLQLQDELPNSPLTAQSMMIYATALAKAGRDQEARTAFDQAFEIYENNPIPLRYERIWPYIRLALKSSTRAAGDAALSIDDADEVETIFRAAQLVKSANTASEIAATASELAEGAGPGAEAIRDWRAAEDEVATLKAVLTQRNVLTAAQEADLQEDLEDALERARLLRDRRDEVAPQYRQRLEAPVSLSDIQASLEEGEALVQVLSGFPRSTIIFVEKDAAKVQVVTYEEKEIATLVAALRTAFTTNPQTGKTGIFRPYISYLIGANLFGALLDDIRAKDKIYFATNGALQNIPLEVLVTEDPVSDDQWVARGSSDYSGVKWLIDDVSISYIPSPRNLVDIRDSAGRSGAANPVIAFGDFEANSDEESILRSTNLPREECGDVAETIAQLQSLPATAREISAARDALGGGSQTVQGPEFTETRVRQLSDSGELEDFKIVHFATHGLLWSETDCINEPALATSIGPGEMSDGLLKSSEIRSLSLDADLVVLSACESVGGDGVLGASGESLSGLARAFFASGARAVIASHWQIQDTASADLMVAMYENLGKNPNTSFDDALSMAQKQLRSTPELSDPFFWAPFVIIGDGSAAFQPAGG